jgi:threonine/homoserine/homoserine lactone efflux protein
MSTYLIIVAYICLVWFIVYMALYTIRRAHQNWKKRQRLQQSIDRIARAQY